MPLTHTKIQSIKPSLKTQKFSDRDGLQLWVSATGSKLWRSAYRFGGKQKLLALGRHPEMSLADARKAHDRAMGLRKEGVDPSEAKKKAKATAQDEQARNQEERYTFKAVAEDFIARQKRNGRADITISKAKWLLEMAYIKFGHKNVAVIRTADVVQALTPLEMRCRYESARRFISTIGCVFRYAIRSGLADFDPTQALRGSLDYPAPKPYPAITSAIEFAQLLSAIDGYSGQPATLGALKLLPLLFTRPGELRAAHWSEFNLQTATWTIPAGRMKKRIEHRVPLSSQSIAILTGLQPITGGGKLVFPSVRTTAKPISENSLNAALRCLGYSKDKMVSHGFRASASTLLNETGIWNGDVIERQLAHREKSKVRRVYDRSEHWLERVKMMQWWGDYLDQLKAGGKDYPPSGGKSADLKWGTHGGQTHGAGAQI